MNIKHRITKLEKHSSIDKSNKELISLELYKEYANGEDISDQLTKPQKQQFAEFWKVADSRLQTVLETLQKYEH